MREKLFLAGLVLLFIMNVNGIAHGDDAVKKLGRGACNLITCPFEIPLQISRVNNTDGPMAAVTYGVMKGVGMTALRAIVGVYEVATFPFPVPRYYKPILTDPEFMFEEKSW